MEKKLVVAIEHLQKADPVINKLIASHGPCTLYDDNSLINQPKFHVLAWAIINQQLSVKSAQSIENKLLSKLPRKHFEPQTILSLKEQELASCGLSRQKIRYLSVMSNALLNNKNLLDDLEAEDDETVARILTEFPGIGPWTVDMFLMFSLARMNVLPLGDLALRKSFALHYSLPERSKIDEYYAIAEAWQPYRTIASWYLWAAVD
jgi:DNA-3-methyladenine glycosylase II